MLAVEYEVLFDLVDIVEHLDTAVQVTRVPQILKALRPVVLNFLLALRLSADRFAGLTTLLEQEVLVLLLKGHPNVPLFDYGYLLRGLLVDFVGLAHSGECCLDFKVDVGMALVNVHTDLEILNESDQHRSVHVVYIHLVREHLGERLQRG